MRIYQEKEEPPFIPTDVKKMERNVLMSNMSSNISSCTVPTRSSTSELECLLSHMDFVMAGGCCTYSGEPTVTWRLWLLSDLISCYRRSLCWSRKGEGGKNAEPQSFTLFKPLLLLLPILDHLCCPDPDHNLGGWCYRKPDAPGEIALLHGDSPLFTSSLTGCLKEEREEGGMWGGWGERR